jgi:two-component system CheB/CheR fusion protein
VGTEPIPPPLPRMAVGPDRRILVVDDSADNADAIGMLLQSYGYEVRVANGGTAAIELAKAFVPDVAIVDLGMPDVDGYTVARTLRRDTGLASLRLIALSGWGQESDKRRSRDAGFDRHLIKPVDPEELRALLADPPEPK